jgi:O-acetyl-ADP-ribose deacetylase (regulator of RNase III)
MLPTLWLIHPDADACDAFRTRFHGLPRTRVVQARFEDLDPHDCFVTAGNSYGMMTAGIDAVVVERFGEQIMREVQLRILSDYFGEQPVGTAFVIPTGDPRIPFLCHAPTMRVPGSIDGTEEVYQATFAALVAVFHHNRTNDRKIETVALPAMGTGFGQVKFDEAARQMAVAYRWFLDPPHRLDWDTVIERHKAICYDRGKQVVN